MFEAATTRLRAVLAALVLAALAGCGGEQSLVKVGGQVRLDGTPLKAGEIQFIPPNGRPASASIESEGHFTLTSATQGDPTREGVIPGAYRVAVSTARIVDEETVTWIAPEKYGDHLTSGIEVVIQKPTDSLIINLSSEVADNVDEGLVEADEQAESKEHEQKVQDEKVAD